ncbi:cellulose-binding domain-containing protein, partial [Paractinoplanes rishiriensis]|uniref:cellulose-binding domain-containing protein n=1 Tax=Paractinoplanes rishiriensis TaxID=1050105 RepID=UPI0019452B9C
MKRKLWLASALALAVAGGITAVATGAQAAVGCRVTYAVTNQWQGGFGANVTIDNLGDPLSGWQLAWTFGAGQTVSSLWNGTVAQSGSQVTVSNTTWNGSVATGGTASFGFNGTWTSANPVPASFTLNGVACTGSTAPTTTPTAAPTTPPTTAPTTTPTTAPTTGP